MSVAPVFTELFESYNKAIQEKCEESMSTVRSFSDFDLLITEAREKWEKTAFNGTLPIDYFKRLKSETDLGEVFEEAAQICDDFIPDSLVQSIKNSDYMKIIEKYAFTDYPIDIKSAAIRIAGLSGDASYSDKLIELLYSVGEFEELLKEKARQALIDIGKQAIPFLEKNLSGKDILSDDDFHIVIALINIDSERKTDSVFQILKQSFRKTSDKALAARCLSDYGDGRAVPMLRSYLVKNIANLDENIIFELQGAILKLGGSTEGLET